MPQIIECVANVSEGRKASVLNALSQSIKGVPEVVLLDHHSDGDHHRSVFTFAGKPNAVIQAAFKLVQTAIPLIDLRTHTGEHPRVGAVDVLPLIPLNSENLRECVEGAKALGQRIGDTLEIPVFLYEEASINPNRKKLEVIRRGGLQGLNSRMRLSPSWIPDCGPRQPHPTAGVVVVGARYPLIAYNIVLNTASMAIAQSIAKSIRTSGGGLPSLKAIGVDLRSRGLVQVSMNLTNFHQTSIQDAFHAVQKEASKRRVEIEESEIVGLIPKDSLPSNSISHLKLKKWNPDQVLETRLSQFGLD